MIRQPIRLRNFIVMIQEINKKQTNNKKNLSQRLLLIYYQGLDYMKDKISIFVFLVFRIFEFSQIYQNKKFSNSELPIKNGHQVYQSTRLGELITNIYLVSFFTCNIESKNNKNYTKNFEFFSFLPIYYFIYTNRFVLTS